MIFLLETDGNGTYFCSYQTLSNIASAKQGLRILLSASNQRFSGSKLQLTLDPARYGEEECPQKLVVFRFSQVLVYQRVHFEKFSCLGIPSGIPPPGPGHASLRSGCSTTPANCGGNQRDCCAVSGVVSMLKTMKHRVCWIVENHKTYRDESDK